jgi:hypothetical protein
MEGEVQLIHYELNEEFLEIAKESIFVAPLMFHNIDSFVTLSRDNTIVTRVKLFPFDSDAGNYEFWDKVGRLVGNLRELQTLQIHLLPPIR